MTNHKPQLNIAFFHCKIPIKRIINISYIHSIFFVLFHHIVMFQCSKYCAPEYYCDGKMSAKSDIYSLGVIILELVTGSNKDPDIQRVRTVYFSKCLCSILNIILKFLARPCALRESELHKLRRC